MPPQNKQQGRDYPLAPTPEPTGTYIHMGSRVGRTHGSYGPYESIDTSGYSKGKENFTLKKTLPGAKYSDKTINRKDVPAKIEEFKKGATGDLSNKGYKSTK